MSLWAAFRSGVYESIQLAIAIVLAPFRAMRAYQRHAALQLRHR
jgi:hypothetical protein